MVNLTNKAVERKVEKVLKYIIMHRFTGICDGNNKYLTANPIRNIVELSSDINDNCQKWIFEKSDLKSDTDNKSDIFCHISTTFSRGDKLKYIGAPNKDNQVYMYSSKNKFTLWKLRSKQTNNDYDGESTASNNGTYEISYMGDKFDTNDIQIVVARYNEPVDWTNAYNDICIIYNKGKVIICPSKVIALSNVGREGNTYLYHIVNSYDDLKRKTIFTQAQFLEHNDTMFYGIDNYFKFTNPIQPMGLRYMQIYQIPPDHYVNKHKTTTDYGFEYAVYNINQNLVNIPIFKDNGIQILLNKTSYMYGEPKKMSIIKGFLSRSNFFANSNVINDLNNLPKLFPFTYCALFCVDNNVIRKNSKNIYQNLSTELIAKEKCGGTNGYVLERLWLYIFGYEIFRT